MVIFFDMQPNLEHGQVQLYAGPGFEAAFLSNEERQAIFENDMLPYLAAGDFDGALAAALDKVDAAATPEHAAELAARPPVQRRPRPGRCADRVPGPVRLGVLHWRRYGKDPVYLDDPSVLMPAPPPDLTAASGAMVMDGATSRRALTTAMLDLASRGLIAFRRTSRAARSRRATRSASTSARPPATPRSRPSAGSTSDARPVRPRRSRSRELQALGAGEDGFISPEDLPKFGSHVGAFDRRSRTTSSTAAGSARSRARSSRAGPAAGTLAIVGRRHRAHRRAQHPDLGPDPASAAAAIAGGIVVLIIARSMPAVTMPGAMIRAMLAAYRRTLQKTMAQARSMQQVVDEAGLPWLDTPDQAVVWGTALGLQGDIEGVLSRSLEDVKAGRDQRRRPYFPVWYQTSSGTPFMSSAGGGSGGEPVLGLGHPGRRRDDVGARDDRQLAVVVGRRRWRRVRRRLVGRWRRRRRRRVLGAAPAGSSGPEHVAAAVQALDRQRRPRSRPPALGGHPELWVVARDALGREAAEAVLLVAEGARHGVRRALSRNADVSATRAPRPSNANPRTAARISLPNPRPWNARPSHEPVSTVR